MQKFVFFMVSILIPFFANAFIPKGLTILERTVDNSGKGVYQIEQEVQFPNGQDVLVLKETWVVENETNLRLTVTGSKELKDQVFFQAIYSGGQKSSGDGSSKMTTDFLERYFHFRSVDSFANALIQLKIAPTTLVNRKALRSLKDVDHTPEGFVRLGRSGGVVNYIFGEASIASADAKSGLWIEQDQFVIRKLRLPNQVEIEASEYTNYPRGLQFPKTRTIRWGQQSASVHVLNVTAKGKEAMQAKLNPITKFDAIKGLPAAAAVEEFYKRFR